MSSPRTISVISRPAIMHTIQAGKYEPITSTVGECFENAGPQPASRNVRQPPVHLLSACFIFLEALAWSQRVARMVRLDG